LTRLSAALVHDSPQGYELNPRGADAELRLSGLRIGVGFVEVQALECASSGLEGSFELCFLGAKFPVAANASLAHLEQLFHLHVPSSAPRPNDPAFAGAALWCARSTTTSVSSSKADRQIGRSALLLMLLLS